MMRGIQASSFLPFWKTRETLAVVGESWTQLLVQNEDVYFKCLQPFIPSVCLCLAQVTAELVYSFAGSFVHNDFLCPTVSTPLPRSCSSPFQTFNKYVHASDPAALLQSAV